MDKSTATGEKPGSASARRPCLGLFQRGGQRGHTAEGIRAGETVNIENAQGNWLGLGHVNPNSLICARLVTRSRDFHLDGSLLVHRIRVALALRERPVHAPYHRLLFGEADGVPGVVVDRYGDHLAVQITTAGMEVQREALVAALVKSTETDRDHLRNDTSVRELEGLTRYIELAHGSVPETVAIEEDGCR